MWYMKRYHMMWDFNIYTYPNSFNKLFDQQNIRFPINNPLVNWIWNHRKTDKIFSLLNWSNRSLFLSLICCYQYGNMELWTEKLHCGNISRYITMQKNKLKLSVFWTKEKGVLSTRKAYSYIYLNAVFFISYNWTFGACVIANCLLIIIFQTHYNYFGKNFSSTYINLVVLCTNLISTIYTFI